MDHESNNDNNKAQGLPWSASGLGGDSNTAHRRRDKRTRDTIPTQPQVEEVIEEDRDDDDIGGPSTNPAPTAQTPSDKRRGKMPAPPHMQHAHIVGDPGRPRTSADSGLADRFSSKIPRVKKSSPSRMQEHSNDKDLGLSAANQGLVDRLTGHGRGRPWDNPPRPELPVANFSRNTWLQPTTTALSYYGSPYGYSYPPPPPNYYDTGMSYGLMLPPQSMAMVPQAHGLPQAPAVISSVGASSEKQRPVSPDPVFLKMKEQLEDLKLGRKRVEEAQSRAELEARIREQEEKRIRDRMDAMSEAQRERAAKVDIEVARAAAEAAAIERVEKARKAEDERRNMAAAMKAQVTREVHEAIEAERKAEGLREAQQAMVTKLAEYEAKEKYEAAKRAEKELFAKEKELLAARERQLIEVEAKYKLLAEQRAAEEAKVEADIKQRRIEELEARERKVFEAEIVNKHNADLRAAEEAMIKANSDWAESKNKNAQEQLDAREEIISEAKTSTHKYAAAFAPFDSRSDVSESTEEDNTHSHSTEDSRSDVSGPAAEDNAHSHSTDDSQSDVSGSTGEDSSNSHSTQGPKSVLVAQPNRFRQLEFDLERPSSKIRTSNDVDAVYHPGHTRDITIHLDLELSPDMEDEIEEFSRLCRIGNFASAESFFDLHLRAHLSDPYVFVQYADMLLEKGDYKALMSLDGSSVFVRRDLRESHVSDVEVDQLELNWKLIQAITLCHSQRTLHAVWEVVEGPLRSLRDTLYVGSTELRNLILAIRLTMLTTEASHANGIDETPLSDWADWRRLYWQLLSEGRIWDFRDAFVTVSTCYGTKNALDAFFDSSSPVEGLLLDWQTDPHDESTQLALLDLLAFIALTTDTSPNAGNLRETCLHLAEPFGNSLLDNFPHLIHSRIFVQWVVAKSVVGSAIGKFKYLANYRGYTAYPGIESGGMPYYVPINGENPGWLPPEPTLTGHESLQMALRTCREIQDYQTEARCLQELSLRTQDPDRSLQELAELQKSKQHDMNGYLATCLTRYLICVTDESKRALLQDMASFGSWEEPSDLLSPTVAAARDVISRSLSLERANESGESIRAALKYYSFLPASFQRILDSNVPGGPAIINREDGWSTVFAKSERPGSKKTSEKKPNAQKRSEIAGKNDRGVAPKRAIRVEDFEVFSEE